MNKWQMIRDYFFGKVPDDIKHSVSKENMHVLRIVSMIVTGLESWLLAMSVILLQNDPEVLKWNVISLLFCIAASAITLILSSLYIKKKMVNLIYPRLVIIGYYLMLTMWGMNVSFRNYRNGAQMLTFLIVQFCFASFTVFPPVLSLVLYTFTYVFFHYALMFYDNAQAVNPFNYFALAVMTIFAAWIHYNTRIRSFESAKELSRLNAQLESISRTDELTGLKNRHALNQDAYLYMNRGLIVMLADVDNFKSFNDKYGHEVGDRVLQAYSNFLQDSFGQNNVYRFGGDEFLVIMRVEEEQNFARGIADWESGMSAMRIENQEDLRIGGSAGYLRGSASSTEELQTLIRQADQALYQAKNSGKNKVCKYER